MINRFRTKCTICGHRNTLRITLGTDIRQEHTFTCAGCGEQIKVALDLDFKDRVSFKEIPGFTAPKARFTAIENCIECDEEGTITNLDPTFFVPRELLHQDSVFPWMYESERIGIMNEPIFRAPFVNDIIAGIGGQRDLRAKLSAFVRAWGLHRRQQNKYAESQLEELGRLVGVPTPTLWQAGWLIAGLFLGQARENEIPALLEETQLCKKRNNNEYQRLRTEYLANYLNDVTDRIVAVLNDYLKYYDQLAQAWIYAVRGTDVNSDVVVSSHDLRSVRMFYGNAFEELATALLLPACLNNIKMGRPFDQFQTMDLKKYLSINKAGRAAPFSDNNSFQCLHDEFDSTIRNASHHGALRLATGSHTIVEYRSGDTGQWKTMAYADYVLKCNRIVFCLMRLLAVQIIVAEDLA